MKVNYALADREYEALCREPDADLPCEDEEFIRRGCVEAARRMHREKLATLKAARRIMAKATDDVVAAAYELSLASELVEESLRMWAELKDTENARLAA